MLTPIVRLMASVPWTYKKTNHRDSSTVIRPCNTSWGACAGTPSGARTLDTLIKSQVLYQLS